MPKIGSLKNFWSCIRFKSYFKLFLKIYFIYYYLKLFKLFLKIYFYRKLFLSHFFWWVIDKRGWRAVIGWASWWFIGRWLRHSPWEHLRETYFPGSEKLAAENNVTHLKKYFPRKIAPVFLFILIYHN